MNSLCEENIQEITVGDRAEIHFILFLNDRIFPITDATEVEFIITNRDGGELIRQLSEGEINRVADFPNEGVVVLEREDTETLEISENLQSFKIRVTKPSDRKTFKIENALLVSC